MKQIELIYRELLYQAIEKENRITTQLELSKKLLVSLSTVNSAIKKLAKMNAVKIEKMNLKIIDIKKILYYWASIRNIEKDIIYKTRVEMPVKEIEKNMPNIIYGAYTAYKLKFNDVPADYSEVYVYANETELKEIKKRYLKNYSNPNLFVLRVDSQQKKYPKTCTIGQLFVELWNLKEWYASDFVKALENEIFVQEK